MSNKTRKLLILSLPLVKPICYEFGRSVENC